MTIGLRLPGTNLTYQSMSFGTLAILIHMTSQIIRIAGTRTFCRQFPNSICAIRILDYNTNFVLYGMRTFVVLGARGRSQPYPCSPVYSPGLPCFTSRHRCCPDCLLCLHRKQRSVVLQQDDVERVHDKQKAIDEATGHMQAECFGLGGIQGSTIALPSGAAKASSSTANT
jgi:hypothetical protein